MTDYNYCIVEAIEEVLGVLPIGDLVTGGIF